MKPRTPAVVTITVAVSLIIGTFYMFLQNFDFITTPIFLATVSISVVLLLINHSLNALIDAERFKQLTGQEQEQYLEALKTPYWTRVWDSAFKSSKEEETGTVKVFDHGYDGITELDNQLPKWYIGLFAVTVVYAVVYFVAYSFTDFAHQDEEYEEEYKTQMAAIAEYDKLKPQATLETAVYKESDIEKGKEIFKNTCAVCHKDDATGDSGPNMHDDYWINILNKKNKFNNFFEMVWSGSENNPTMRAFGATGEMKGDQIQAVASFLTKLNDDSKKNADGTAAGKAKEGTLFVNWGEEDAQPEATGGATELSTDATTTGAATDSTSAQE